MDQRDRDTETKAKENDRCDRLVVWAAKDCKDFGKDSVADSMHSPPQTHLGKQNPCFFQEKERLGLPGKLGDSLEAHCAPRLLLLPLAQLASHLGMDTLHCAS